jgi:hypothetical protein
MICLLNCYDNYDNHCKTGLSGKQKKLLRFHTTAFLV